MLIIVAIHEMGAYAAAVTTSNEDPRADAPVWTPGREDRPLLEQVREVDEAQRVDLVVEPAPGVGMAGFAVVAVDDERAGDLRSALDEAVSSVATRVEAEPGGAFAARDRDRATQWLGGSFEGLVSLRHTGAMDAAREIFLTGAVWIVARKCPHGCTIGTCSTSPCVARAVAPMF